MPNFPLSSFRKIGNTLYISGQIGQQNGELISEDIEDQVAQAVANIKAILEQNNLALSSVIDVTAFLVDQNDYAAFNDAYEKSFSEPYPSRTTVTVKSLPLHAKVELKAIATIEL
jgi:2-iminobutanoate/2-iminopropanoate deaminase